MGETPELQDLLTQDCYPRDSREGWAGDRKARESSGDKEMRWVPPGVCTCPTRQGLLLEVPRKRRGKLGAPPPPEWEEPPNFTPEKTRKGAIPGLENKLLTWE